MEVDIGDIEICEVPYQEYEEFEPSTSQQVIYQDHNPEEIYQCAECHEFFETEFDYFWHAEDCLTAAFEVEVQNQNRDNDEQILVNLHGQTRNENQHVVEVNPEIAEFEEDSDDGPPLLELEVDEIDLPGPSVEVSESETQILYPPEIPNYLLRDDGSKPKMLCPVCKIELYRHNFAAHYRVHTGELPYPCEFCEKRFRTSSSLKVHIRVHTGEKPYHCEKCDYATVTKRNLNRHFLIHHVRGSKSKPTRIPRYHDNNYDTAIQYSLIEEEFQAEVLAPENELLNIQEENQQVSEISAYPLEAYHVLTRSKASLSLQPSKLGSPRSSENLNSTNQEDDLE